MREPGSLVVVRVMRSEEITRYHFGRKYLVGLQRDENVPLLPGDSATPSYVT